MCRQDLGNLLALVADAPWGSQASPFEDAQNSHISLFPKVIETATPEFY
jgi:hypothetical protein